MEDEKKKIESEREELEAVLKVVSSEVPKLIENIIKPLKDILNEFYSPESVKRRAEAFASFYKTLVDSGIPPEEALKIAKSQILDINMILERIFGSFNKRDKRWEYRDE